MTPNNLDTLFDTTEQTTYTRIHKKYFQNRIEKANDKVYALEQYIKDFRFNVEFPFEVNDYFKDFISFFESHYKMDIPISSSIKLMRQFRRPNNEVSIKLIENEPVGKNNNNDEDRISIISIVDADTGEVIEFPSEPTETEQEEKINSIYNTHHYDLPDEMLVKEFASWKAKARFLKLLKEELIKLDKGIGEVLPDEKHPEFTMWRQMLAIYYIDLVLKLNKGKPIALSRFIHFVTGKNLKNISDALKNPLKISDKKKVRADERLIDDLKFIRQYFVDMGLTDIVKNIDEDIKSASL